MRQQLQRREHILLGKIGRIGDGGHDDVVFIGAGEDRFGCGADNVVALNADADEFHVQLFREQEYLPKALQNPADLEARYFLAYAALIAGISFDNGLLHYTHALEHPLSGVNPNLTHGLGLAMLLPAVVKNIYPTKAKTLADVLKPLAPQLKGDPSEADTAACAVEKWLYSVGADHKLEDEGFTAEHVDKLVELAFTTPSLGGLLSIAPTAATKEAVRAIYEGSLKPCHK